MAGLSAVGKVAEVNAQNEASALNRQNAITAMNDEQSQEMDSYIEQNRSLIQGGFDAVLQGREDEATAYTSALQNGVQGGSVKAVLRENRQRASRNAYRTEQEQDSLRTQTGHNQRGIQAKAQGRINSVPTTSFNFGDLGTVLSPIMRSAMG